MRICIIDPAAHIPALQTLFPEADYFAHEPDDFFRYVTTRHDTKQEVKRDYGIDYRTDWESITSSRYDYVFLTAPLADYYDTCSSELTLHCQRMKQKIKHILDSNQFKCVCLFDTYDYDYDPSIINTDWKVDFYFKRNYVRSHPYATNVFPFPYIMFVKPCVLNMTIHSTVSTVSTSSPKINKALWAGGIYNHIDEKRGICRMRKNMYDQIKQYVDTRYFTESTFLEAIRQYKVVVDLIGVGNPNKRTIEILTNGTLMLSMCGDLEWGFDNGDRFHPDTFFDTVDEFKEKLLMFLTNDAHYETCMKQQNYIVQTYFNKKWLRQYIQKNIGYRHDTVSLFLTSCNRPQLLKQTLESFVNYNTYPIEYGVIVEDSGLKGINDFAHDIVPFPLTIIYADQRRGQMKSIENGLQYVNTDYVFHCEEDWEFYDNGFIEESLRILKKNSKITSVWLRSQDEIVTRYHIPIHLVENDNYYTVGPETGNFSWNPGLRTIETHTMFSPYETHNLTSICEGGLSIAFRTLGMTSAMTHKKYGYVKHIGWNQHIW